MRFRVKNKNSKYVSIVMILVLIIGIGYAALFTDLRINGEAKIKSIDWDVHFDNIVVKNGSVAIDTENSEQAATIVASDSITYTISLHNLGDFYEFNVDVVNSGGIDAMIGSIVSKLGDTVITSSNLPSYLEYYIRYSDNREIEPNHKIKVGSTETYKVHIGYKEDVTGDDLPETDQTLVLTFEPKFVQSDSNAVEVHHLRLGDYVTFVPDASTYSIPASETGLTDQAITPSELTIWRIVNIYDDGSADAVSEYVSSNDVRFLGATGYTKLVKTLQTISTQYAKTGVTSATRMMGYDGQTLEIVDTSAYTAGGILSGATNTGSPTSGVGSELDTYGPGVVGDTLYLRDYQMVSNVYSGNTSAYGASGLKSSRANATAQYTNYYLASRTFVYEHGTNYAYNYYRFHYIGSNGAIDNSSSSSFSNNLVRCNTSTTCTNFDVSAALRPIVTLRNDVVVGTGDGTRGLPYVLSANS